ncbi:dynamin family protein [Macrococcus capreoli]
MRTRQDYNERKIEILKCFDDAIALGEGLKEKYQKYIPIENMNSNLSVQKANWNNERFEIVIVGEFSTGKSTFINALLQKNVLPSKATPTTATINFIRHINELGRDSKDPVAIVVYNDGKEIEIPYDELTDYVAEMSTIIDVSKQIHHVDLFIESPYLENGVVLVDTPGLQALNPEHERITKDQIKKSNASILLFNMGQPGRLTEIKFLRDLSDSIDRIFFVANRMDEVNENEIDEVKDHLEMTLKNNEYQIIQESRAIVYPVSAYKALLARDHSVQSQKFEGKSKEDLEKESHLKEFENILENYLFNGEKFEDYLSLPFHVIEQYYSELLNQFETYKSNLENDNDIQEVEKKYELIKSQIEVRNEQLKSEVSKLRSEIRSIKRSNTDSFAGEFSKLVNTTQHAIESINDLEYFVEEVNDELELFNSSYAALKDNKIKELSYDVMELIQNKIENFELQLTSDKNMKTFEAKLRSQSRKVKSIDEIEKQVESELSADKEFLKEENKKLKEKEKLNENIRDIERKRDNTIRFYEDELMFTNMMLESTNATIPKNGVIRHRKFWFDKTGIIEVPNERYDALINERKQIQKRKFEEEQKHEDDLAKVKKLSIDYDSVFEDKDEFREEERRLKEKERRRKVELLEKESKHQAQLLKQEQRKVIANFKTFAREVVTDYKGLIKEMDGLKAAEQKIDEYIQSNDELLEESKRTELMLSEQLNSSLEEKQTLENELAKINEYIKNKKIELELCRE